MLKQAEEPTVTIKSHDGTREYSVKHCVGTGQLLWRHSYDSNRQVEIKTDPRNARADLAFSGNGHAQAEVRGDIIPDTQSTQERIMPHD